MFKFAAGLGIGLSVGAVGTTTWIFIKAMESVEIRTGIQDAISNKVEYLVYGDRPEGLRRRRPVYPTVRDYERLGVPVSTNN